MLPLGCGKPLALAMGRLTWELLPTCQIILKVAIHGKLRLKLRNMFLLILYLDAMLTLMEQRHSRQHEIVVRYMGKRAPIGRQASNPDFDALLALRIAKPNRYVIRQGKRVSCTLVVQILRPFIQIPQRHPS